VFVHGGLTQEEVSKIDGQAHEQLCQATGLESKPENPGPVYWEAWGGVRDRLLAEAAAEKKQREGRKLLTCSECGQTGYTWGHPFSTAPSTGMCDDCL